MKFICENVEYEKRILLFMDTSVTYNLKAIVSDKVSIQGFLADG